MKLNLMMNKCIVILGNKATKFTTFISLKKIIITHEKNICQKSNLQSHKFHEHLCDDEVNLFGMPAKNDNIENKIGNCISYRYKWTENTFESVLGVRNRFVT